MIKKVELGNFDRGGPIMLKEKTSADGTITTRIYQRKDVQSIENLSKKIITAIKYGIEDFFISHKNFHFILQKTGINRINKLSFGEIKNPEKLFQSIKSGKISPLFVENEIKNLKNIFNFNEIDPTSLDELFISNYKNSEFFEELETILEENKIEDIGTPLFRTQLLDESSFEITMRNYNSLNNDYNVLILAINEINKKQPSENIKIEFLKRKLKSICENIVVKRLSDATTKKILLDLCGDSEEIKNNIERAFSNHWLISKDTKQKALKSVQIYLQEKQPELQLGFARRVFGATSSRPRKIT